MISDLYWVMGVCVLVWLGLFVYLLRLDRRIGNLENRE